MTPKQWANIAEAAYDSRDRDSFTRAVARLLFPDFGTYTRAQLLEAREQSFRRLIDIHDRLAAQDGAGRLTHAIAPLLQLPVEQASLDSSE